MKKHLLLRPEYKWVILLILFGLYGCQKEDQRELDRTLILEYLTQNNLNASEGQDGLFYIIEKEGTGLRPGLFSEVTVHYRGTLLDGSLFDSSYDRGRPAIFPLQNVIRGWQLGIPLFKEGGKGKLLIPSHLAYGNNPPAGSIIPSKAVLIFEIELLDVN